MKGKGGSGQVSPTFLVGGGSEMGKLETEMDKEFKPKVTLLVQPTEREPTPAWRKLWRLLAAARKTTPATRETAHDGEMSNENDANLSNQ